MASSSDSFQVHENSNVQDIRVFIQFYFGLLTPFWNPLIYLQYLAKKFLKYLPTFCQPT